jgi:hypothetical protein
MWWRWRWCYRQTDASVFTTQNYTITLSTSEGNLTVPLLGGSLELRGKDSKIHVTDYEAGSTTLLYSTAEIFTWCVLYSMHTHDPR